MALSCSAGSSPPGAAAPSPAATRPARPATRTMKNSSRLAEKIATNFSRSKRGTEASSARARTRALKSSHERSRSSSSPPSVSTGAATSWAATSFLADFFAIPSPYGGDALHRLGGRLFHDEILVGGHPQLSPDGVEELTRLQQEVGVAGMPELLVAPGEDRKSTRLNSSHSQIS